MDLDSLGYRINTLYQAPNDADFIFVGNSNGVLRCPVSVRDACTHVARTDPGYKYARDRGYNGVRALAVVPSGNGAGAQCTTAPPCECVFAYMRWVPIHTIAQLPRRSMCAVPTQHNMSMQHLP